MTTKSFKEIPLADGLPILGNALKLTSRDFHRDLYAIARELGGIFRVTAPGKTIVVVSDPNILQEMVKDENVNFTKPKDLYKTFAELCSTKEKPEVFPVLATSNIRQWATIRKGFEAAFAPDTVKQYLPTLLKEVSVVMDQTCDTTDQKGHLADETVDILEYVGRVSLSATGKIMFDYDFDCTDLDQPPVFWKALITARMGSVDKARNPLIGLEYRFCPFLPGPEQWKDNLNIVRRTYTQVYNKIRSDAPEKFSVGADAATTIKDAFYTTPDWQDGSQPLGEEDVIATIGNLVVAGTMPAASATAYTLALIACSPSVQERIHEELDSIGLNKRTFEASDIEKLKYTNMVIKEAMRVNPTVPQVIREAAADVVLGGYKIPKGTVLMMSMGGCHTSPHNYTQETKFWPERWELSPEQAAAQSDSTYPKACPIGNLDNLDGSHIPFSTGPRACLGQHWARLSILTLVSSILSRFTLSAADELTTEKLAADEIFSISIYPHHPIMITLTRRK